MGNYYLLRDGLITDSSKYGISAPQMEKTNNTDAYTLTTSNSWSVALTGSSDYVIDSIAVHLSSRAAIPVGALSATLESHPGPVAKSYITTSTDSPFVGVGSSLMFNGSSSSAFIPASPDVDLLTGDFTVELWAKFPTTGLSFGDRVVMLGAVNNPSSLQLMIGNSGNTSTTHLSLYGGSGATYWANNTTKTVNDNTWYHIAITRAGTALRLFIGGNQIGATYNTTITLSSGAAQGMYIGSIAGASNFTKMSLSNLRIIKGTALYIANFPTTVPSAPLDPIAGTTFLYKDPYSDVYENTSVSNVINSVYPVSSFTSYDGSDNTISTYPLNWQLLKLSSPFTNSTKCFKLNLKTSNPNQLTVMGSSTVDGVSYDIMSVLNSYNAYGSLLKADVTIDTDSPFGIGNDSSMSFNGTTSYARSPGSPDFDFGTGNFTIEFWIKVPVSGNAHADRILCFGETSSSSIISFIIGNNDGNANYLSVVGSVYLNNNSTVTINNNQWRHVAFTRSGVNTCMLFIDGVKVGANVTYGASLNNGGIYGLRLGSFSNTLNFGNFKISNIRITKGTALYTAAFTRPSAAFDAASLPTPTTSCSLYKAPYANYEYTTTAENLHVGGTIDGYSTQNRTITADTTTLENVYVHKNGLFKFPNTSTTLSVAGSNGLQVTSEGTIQIGSSASPVPSDTTHQIILPGNHIGVSNGGRLDVYGAYKPYYTYLTADSVSQLTFSVVDSVSSTWKVGDILSFTPNTTQGSSSYDIKSIASFTNANTFVIDSLPNFLHNSITSLPYVPTVANLTRNVKIGGTSYTIKGNIQAKGGAFVNLNNAEFKYIDGSLSTGVNSNGLFSISGCTLSGSGTETLITSIDTEFATVFNGTNSSITGPANNTDFKIESGKAFTIEFFIKVNSFTSKQCPFRVGKPSITATTDSSFIFRTLSATKNISFQIVPVGTSAGGGVTRIDSASNSLTVGKWQHVAAVGDGTIIKLYLDGKLQSSKTQVNLIFASTFISQIGDYNYSTHEYFNGKLSNLRFVNGLAVYTSNFTPPTDLLQEITGSGIATAILTLQDGNNTPVDNSYRNASLTLNNITTELDSPFGKLPLNTAINNNVMFKSRYGILLENTPSDNSTVKNNLLLSSKDAGLYIVDGIRGNITFNNNISVGPSPYGSYIENNITGNTLSGTVNYNNTYGMYINNSHAGRIDNSINTYNTKDGVYVDGTIAQLNETIFSNITASNNKTLGFRVTGNPIDHLSPITLNINRLVANNNLSGGFEGYCISGNLSSLELNRNGFYGIKTSIGNYNTTFDGITALMSNTAGISASLGILSGICYYPILIDKANLGKSDPASTFGAGIILDSTKFSQFIVNNSTVKGGTFDFQLKTSRDIIEGSYLISKTTVSNTPVGLGITPANYQSDTYKATGFAFTNMNNTSGYHITYLAAGQRFSDTGIYATLADAPSERLTPSSNSIKLKSGSKFVALNANERTLIKVYVKKSNASNGSIYNGTAPRLMLRAAPHMGIPADIVMVQLNTAPAGFELLTASTPAVTDSGVLEFYVDCDGTVGWINVDNWSAT